MTSHATESVFPWNMACKQVFTYLYVPMQIMVRVWTRVWVNLLKLDCGACDALAH